MHKVLGYTKDGRKIWSDNTPTLPVEPVLPDTLFVVERVSWRDGYQQQWEKQRKAKAA